MTGRPLSDDLMRDADHFGFIAVDRRCWSSFVKLAFARDAYRGFLDLMRQLRGAAR